LASGLRQRSLFQSLRSSSTSSATAGEIAAQAAAGTTASSFKRDNCATKSASKRHRLRIFRHLLSHFVARLERLIVAENCAFLHELRGQALTPGGFVHPNAMKLLGVIAR
jgi:hypothetical protein